MKLIHLPHGGGLSETEFRRRHRALLAVLWAAVPALPLFSLAQGAHAGHALLHSAPVLLLALLARSQRFPRRLQASLCSVGLLSAAALFVHAWHGLTEGHFAFFVLIIALTLYEDWTPFLLAVGFVLLHHGVGGMLDPAAVYSGAPVTDSPWKWAAIHAAFVAAAGSAGVAVWSFNESLRREKESLVHRLTREDPLTGVANRRAWDERFAHEVQRANRSGEPFYVAMIDLDNLKVVNDTEGHEAGDRLLTEATTAWQQTIRQTDFLARLGGDEFGVLLPNCDEEAGQQVVQRMLDAMPVGRGFSAGIARWDGHEATRDLVRRADEALYAAKDAGRGRLDVAASRPGTTA